MNTYLLELAREADGFLGDELPPEAELRERIKARLRTYEDMILSMKSIGRPDLPALRQPSTPEPDGKGQTTGRDLLPAAQDLLLLWRLALETPPDRGPYTVGLVLLLCWAAGLEAGPHGMGPRPVLRPYERRALGVWCSVPGKVGDLVATLLGSATLPPVVCTWEVLDLVDADDWGAFERETYRVAVGQGLVPRPLRLVTTECRRHGKAIHAALLIEASQFPDSWRP